MRFKSLLWILLVIAAIVGIRFFIEWVEPYLDIKMSAGSISEKDSLLIDHFKGNCFGIDVSHYQGNIDWDKVENLRDSIPISFVIMRATMGEDGKDNKFKINWRKAKSKGIKVGAYHYYRPNENSSKQAANFKASVKQDATDLPPVLDIEDLPDQDVQSIDRLRTGLKNYLALIEKEYQRKPIIYTGKHFYNSHLKNKGFDDYPLWIANYNYTLQPGNSTWKLWQFTDAGVVDGINHKVDVNIFNGNCSEFLDWE